MSGINTGKVITGGLVAGVFYNVFDFVVNGVLMASDYAANAARLGLDEAAMQTTAAIVGFIVVDFIFGLLIVWTYAAMRPRFGPGPRTAVYAALVPWLAVAIVMFTTAQGGMVPMGLFWKMSILQLVNSIAGALLGAWVYKEADAA